MSIIDPISAIGSAPVLSANAVQGGAQAAKTFSSYLQSAAADTVGTLRDGEKAMIGGANGTLGAQDVVNAVVAAETTLQTVVAVRDKAISAYTELLRMPI